MSDSRDIHLSYHARTVPPLALSSALLLPCISWWSLYLPPAAAPWCYCTFDSSQRPWPVEDITDLTEAWRGLLTPFSNLETPLVITASVTADASRDVPGGALGTRRGGMSIKGCRCPRLPPGPSLKVREEHTWRGSEGVTWQMLWSLRRTQQTDSNKSHLPSSFLLCEWGKQKEQPKLSFLYPKWLTFECFAPKKPSNSPWTLLSSFRELLLRFVRSLSALLVNSCTFLGKGSFFFSHDKLKVFSPIIEAEGFSCFVALTGL